MPAPKILTHTCPANPPLLLTNERIITFADLWRGEGEAREVGREGSVHFSKQEMNSSCCGHLSLERKKGGLTGCSVTLLPSEAQVRAYNANGAPSILQSTDADPQ